MGADEFVTRQEILSQPETWRETLHQLTSNSHSGKLRIQDYERILCIGCGSTHYLSIWAARLLQVHTQVECQAQPSSEILFHPEMGGSKDRKTLLVAISRSGQTSETIEAVRTFKSRGAGDCLAITCYPESDLSSLADHVIGVPAAQEQSVAQTRSFTNMMLGVSSLIQGSPSPKLAREFGEAGAQLLEGNSSVAVDLGRDAKMQRFFYLGSHSQYGLASEAMLKMKEMSLSYSEAYHFMEFRHGPMSMINEESVVLALISQETFRYELAVLQDMKKLGARIVAITPDNLTSQIPMADHLIRFPVVDGNWAHVFYLPILQLLAFERAVFKGLNPDRPKNLEAVVALP
ncbi:MAG: SIS domain-containing protein [Chloroflexi bacterium]|nr:SIS domain-containing protein [Chloroflexota bacterium]